MKVDRFQPEDRHAVTTFPQSDTLVLDAIWIRDQWLRECHDRIRVLDAVLQEWLIVHPAMLDEDEVLPGEQR